MSKSDLLFYGLFLLGFLLFNYIIQQAAKRARQQQEEEQARQEEAAPAEDEPLEDIWGRKPQASLPAVAAPVEPPRRVAAIPAAPAPAPRLLFRTRQDLRHAVVVMTVLGPCRALEPHERR